MTEKMQRAIEHIDKQAEKENSAVKIIAQYIIENLIKTDSSADKLLDEKHTLASCFTQIKSKAKSKAVSGCACIDDNTVYAWVREYFGIDSSDLDSAVSRSTADILSFDMFGDL